MSSLDIESFIDSIENLDLNIIELSDILWLAKYMKTDRKYYDSSIKEKEPTCAEEKYTANQEEKKKETAINETRKEKVKESNDIDINLSIKNNDERINRKINIRHKNYFHDSNQILKYLVGFKNKSFSNKRVSFDEKKTVDYKANTGILNPFYKAKKQKLYTLYLFIDCNSSMSVWKEIIEEYINLLNSGIFKTIKYVYFNNADKTLFYKDKKLKNEFNPREIINLKKDKLIFILTDMLSNGWRNGYILKVIGQLYKSIPIYVIQMLPYRLWNTTALKKANITVLNSKKKYPLDNNFGSNIDYILESSSLDRKAQLKIPIVNFDLSYLKVIAGVLNKKDSKIDGAVFNLKNIEKNEVKKDLKTLTAQEKVEYFFANASPEAQELAKCLSAIQFNLPIMRMIQEKVLNESSNIYIAEVINSGLISYSDDILEFDNDVGDVLFRLLGTEKAFEIAYKNSDYIQENLGANCSFKAYVTGAIDLDSTEISERDKKFAIVSSRILKSMGGDYASFADDICEKFRKNDSSNQFFLRKTEFEKSLFVSTETINKIWYVLNRGENVYLYGSGGIGKTTILKYIENTTRNKYFIKYLNLNILKDLNQLEKNLQYIKDDKILLLFDNYDEAILNLHQEHKINDLFSRLHRIKHLQFIITGRSHINNFKINFLDEIRFIEVKEFNKSEIHNLITNFEKLHKIEFEKDAKEYIINNYSSPFLIKIIIDSCLVIDDKKITKKVLIESLSYSYKDALMSKVEQLPQEERNIAITILNYISIRVGFLPLNTLFKENSSISSEVLNKLLEFSILIKDGNYYSFIHKSFAEFWRNNITNFERFMNFLLKLDLYNLGWDDSKINKYLVFNDKFADVMFIDDGGKPFGLIEIKSKILNIKDSTKQVVSYALELGVNLAYITDGNLIYKCDIDNKTSRIVDNYISFSDFSNLINISNENYKKILWFDDNPDNNKYERKRFEEDGVSFELALSTNEALELLKKNKYSAVISDMGRKEGPMEGYVLLDSLRKFDKVTPLFFYAGSNLVEHKKMAYERGAQGSTNNIIELHELVMTTISNDKYFKKEKSDINGDITFNCKKCETSYSFDCKDLQWEQVSGNERNMGSEYEHVAEYYKSCDNCNNSMNIIFTCWEYPIGVEKHNEVTSKGVINLNGSCCKEFNFFEEQNFESVEDSEVYKNKLMTWNDFFKEEEKKEYYQNLMSQVNKAYETTTVFPPKEKIFNAFDLTPLENTKVVLLGQDPYHGAGQAQGLAFSTPEDIKNPPSMRNMLKEIEEDIGSSTCTHGDLTSWAKDGVLLINAILTVEEAKAKSHHKMGWETFTDNLIKFISSNCKDVVFILWGSSAIKKEKIIDKQKHHILSGVHPSPLSAYRGFFGCKHFSKTNEILKDLGKEPIRW